LCVVLELVPLRGEKTFQATPTKQDLGTLEVLFKISDKHPCPCGMVVFSGEALLHFSSEMCITRAIQAVFVMAHSSNSWVVYVVISWVTTYTLILAQSFSVNLFSHVKLQNWPRQHWAQNFSIQ